MLNEAALIEDLIEIKMSIIENATDVLWMRRPPSTTMCEHLDAILISLGVPEDVLQAHYDGDIPKVAEGK